MNPTLHSTRPSRHLSWIGQVLLASLTAVITGIPAMVNAQDNPVAWWQFDEAAGTTATDATGNGHEGMLLGNAVFEPAGGMFGGAVSLDGDGDFVEVTDADDLEFPQGQDFSITFFFNSGGIASDNNNGLITKGYGTNVRSAEGYYLLQVTNPAQFEFDSRGPDALGPPRTRTGLIGPSITDGAWHNVTIVRDYGAGLSGEIRSYIDGTLESTIAMGVGTDGDWNMGVNADTLHIGNHFNRFTTGKFDDVALWRRALSDEEIASIVAGGVISTLNEIVNFFTANPGSVLAGSPSTLSWSVEPGADVTIDQGIGDVTGLTNASGNGSIEVMPTSTTTYSLNADNGIISENVETQVNVLLIESFDSSAGSVGSGDPVTLSWVVSPLGTVTIDQGVGNVDAQTTDGVGSIEITPAASATYTLTVTNNGDEETATVSVNVLVETDGPIAYWPFDEADGTTAADLSGSANEHPAELTGAVFDPAGGFLGGAVSFNGTSDEVRAPDHEDYEFPMGQDFSVTLFYNSGGVAATTNDGLITKGYGDNPRSPEGYWLIQVTASQLVEFDSRCCADATPRTRSGTVGPSITDGEWHNVTLVRDYGAGNYRIYVDGTNVHTHVLNETDGGDWNMGVNDQDVVIGDHLERFTTGKIDEVAIWRRVLSDDEIATINAEGVAPLLGPSVPFVILEITYTPEAGEVSFSWPSRDGQSFIVERSRNLILWEELDDGYPAAADPAETTTYVDDNLAGEARMYYRVRRN